LKFLREPLVHFVLIGAGIYLLYGVFAEPAPEADDKTIVVTAGELEWMQTSWQQRWNRPPTPEEFDGLVQQYIRETVLYREALTMGLNQHDQVIRRRLAQKLEFLAKDLVALTPPTEEELQAYFAEHQLIALGDRIDEAGEFGDSFMLQTYYPDKDLLEIRKSFGSGFVETLTELSPGQWHGPVLSGYGVHLVYVSHINQPAPPVFADKRERVMQDWKTDRGEELNEKFYANLRENYTIVIEEPDPDDNVAVLQEPE
jgi:peptidyl-prolyl cis-trans isomerase C